MLVLHLITDLRRGGAPNQLQQLVLACDKRHSHHMVVSILEGGSIAAELKTSGIEVHSLGMKSIFSLPVGIGRLVRLLRRFRPDVLHCWLYHGCLLGLLGARLAAIHRVIWGLRSANPGLRDYSLMTRTVVRLCARFSSLPQAIVVNSERSWTVHKMWGYETARMAVIPNGVNVQRFLPDPCARTSVRQELGLNPDSPLAGMFARYSPMKDHRTFLRAAALVHQQHPDVYFLLAGEDITGSNQVLSQLVLENGLQEAVHLLGPRHDIPRLTAALDIACLSSWSESFPNVIAEAMACAVPCAVTDAGDASSIAGDTGRIVSPCDPAALAEAMRELLAMQPSERAVLGQKARERLLARFTLEKMLSAYQDIYDESSGKCNVE